MYKIYIYETPIFLLDSRELPTLPDASAQLLIARYTGRSKSLLAYIDMLEKTGRYEAVYIHHSDVKLLFKDFRSLYQRINAAGGLVYNEQEELLLIFRRGYWDLPKGKIEKGERKKEAAIREVMEETGLQQLDCVDKLGLTLHTYRLESGQRILKYNYWYFMKTKGGQLIPQAIEDIEKAVWMSLDKALQEAKPMYLSIRDVLLLAHNNISDPA